MSNPSNPRTKRSSTNTLPMKLTSWSLTCSYKSTISPVGVSTHIIGLNMDIIIFLLIQYCLEIKECDTIMSNKTLQGPRPEIDVPCSPSCDAGAMND